jgi:hypothetical protein
MGAKSRNACALSVAAALCGWTTPSFSQAVTWAELQGSVIQSSTMFSIHRRINGREDWDKVRGSWKILVGPGQTITGTLTREGGAGIKSESATFTLGRPQAFADGSTVWFFENGLLVNLRTFQAGGIKVTYTFSRRAGGLACTVKAPFVRESGVATIQRDSIRGGGNVEILGTKIDSSTCRVSRR